MHGIYVLLATMPAWLFVVLFEAIVLGIPASVSYINEKCEMGWAVTPFGVNVAFSGASLGFQLCLLPIFLIGQGILQRGELVPFALVGWQQFLLAVVWWSGCACYSWFSLAKRHGHMLDLLHQDLLVMPGLVFLFVALIPIIGVGRWHEVIASIVLVMLFFGFLQYDQSSGRFVQAPWIIKHVIPIVRELASRAGGG